MATAAKKKKTATSTAGARAKTPRATTGKKPAVAKYEQAGAPWWKRIPLPQPKS